MPLVLIFVVFYFLLIRPQQKKMKDHRAMLTQLKRNDRVVTAGGIVATITKVKEGSGRDRGRDRPECARHAGARHHHQRGAPAGGQRPGLGSEERLNTAPYWLN